MVSKLLCIPRRVVTFTIRKLFLPPLVTKVENSIPEGNLMKSNKGDPKASFFVSNIHLNYFTMNF